MGYGGYSVPCRVGNWQEDEILKTIGNDEHLSKSSAGLLTTQRLGNLISRATAPVELSPLPEDGFIRFGNVIMLSSAKVVPKHRALHTRQSMQMALSLDNMVNANHF